MYYIVSYFDVPEGRRQEFIDAALEDRRNSLSNEPGTKRIELIKDHKSPDRFYLNEAYDDEAAFDVHKCGPYFKRFFDAIADFAAGPTSLITGTRVDDSARLAYFIDADRAEQPTEAERKHFIGSVTMQRFGKGVVPAGADVVVVFFDPGARTRPHVHPADQVLYFISGRGFVAFPGEEDQEIDEGGVFIVPAGML